MQQQVAVDPPHLAQFRRVARRAADRLKHRVSPRGHNASVRRPLHRGRQSTQEPGQQLALFFIHVKLQLGWVKVLGGCEARLMMAGHLEAELVRTRGPDEIAERCNLTFPAESAEPAVGQRAHPSFDLGELGERSLLSFAQDLIGDRIDEP